MKYALSFILKLALLLAALSCCFGQRTYTATPINVPAYNYSSLIWISDDGTTGFGSGTQVDPFLQQCFTYLNGVVTPIATPGQVCGAVAGNTGGYLLVVSPPYVQSYTGLPSVPAPAQLFDYKNNQFNLLLPPDGTIVHPSEAVSAVNSHGQIATTLLCPAPSGFSGLTSFLGTVYCPYSISSSGVFTRLPADQAGHAYATAINANGDIAGYVSPLNGPGLGAAPQPIPGNLVVWPQSGGMKIIPAPSSFQLGIPVAMNAKGQIVGPGYIYDGVSSFLPLQMTGASKLTPFSINENGEVVGNYQPKTADGIARPFYYVNGTAVDLNALVTNLPQNKLLTSATYINNAGQILVTSVDVNQPIAIIATGAAYVQYLLTPSTAVTAPVVSSVLNGASGTAGISSGAFVSIQGVNLSTDSLQWSSSDFINGKLPTSLAGVSVTINDLPAYINYVSPAQINLIAPDDATTGPVQVVVKNSKGTSNSFTVTKTEVMPAFFTQSSKYVAALHADGSSVGPLGTQLNLTPAHQGEEIQLFGTGFGVTAPASPAGQLITTPVPLANSVTVLIGGLPASVRYAGRTANGLDQLNVIVPSVFPDGDVIVQAKVNGVPTQANVLLSVKF